jgi:hypothetical protein
MATRTPDVTLDRIAAPRDDVATEIGALMQATDENGQPRFATRDLCLLVAATLLRAGPQLDLSGQAPLLAAVFTELGLPRDPSPEQLAQAVEGQQIDPELLAALEGFASEAASDLSARASARERARALGLGRGLTPSPAATPARPRGAQITAQDLQKARQPGKQIFK